MAFVRPHQHGFFGSAFIPAGVLVLDAIFLLIIYPHFEIDILMQEHLMFAYANPRFGPLNRFKLELIPCIKRAIVNYSQLVQVIIHKSFPLVFIQRIDYHVELKVEITVVKLHVEALLARLEN